MPARVTRLTAPSAPAPSSNDASTARERDLLAAADERVGRRELVDEARSREQPPESRLEPAAPRPVPPCRRLLGGNRRRNVPAEAAGDIEPGQEADSPARDGLLPFRRRHPPPRRRRARSGRDRRRRRRAGARRWVEDVLEAERPRELVRRQEAEAGAHRVDLRRSARFPARGGLSGRCALTTACSTFPSPSARTTAWPASTGTLARASLAR